MGHLYLLRVWLCVMLFMVFASELSPQFPSEALLHVRLQSNWKNIFNFALLSTVFNVKYWLGVLHKSNINKIKLHNLFELNADYLMSCPAGVLLLDALQQLKLNLRS